MSHLPNYDAWLEGPYTDEECDCEDGCANCDRELARDLYWSTHPGV